MKYNQSLWQLLVGLIAISPMLSTAQSTMLSLTEVVDYAVEHAPSIKRDQLAVQEQRYYSRAGQPAAPTQLFYSSEELGIDGTSGIHSINVQQNFYLPAVGKRKKAYYEHRTEMAEHKLSHTKNEIIQEVSLTYLELWSAQREEQLMHEHVQVLAELLDIAKKRLALGESGKIPLAVAKSEYSQAILLLEHAIEKKNIARSNLNLWIGNDANTPILADSSWSGIHAMDTSIAQSCQLTILSAARDASLANVAVRESLLLPQINTGLMLQSVNGSIPAFGFQVGVNVPLFSNGQHQLIHGAKVAVDKIDANIDAMQQQLRRQVSKLSYQRDHQLHVLEYLEQDLKPTIIEQLDAQEAAFTAGEVNYQAYLTSLHRWVDYRRQLLEAEFEYHSIQIQLQHLCGSSSSTSN